MEIKFSLLTGIDHDKMEEMKQKFHEQLQKVSLKANSAFMTIEKYQHLLQEVQNVKRVGKKRPKDFWLLKHYDVVCVQGVDKLIAPTDGTNSTTKYYVSDDELFYILYAAHIKLGHGGRDRMVQELNRNYKNITHQQITMFIQCCEVCQQKRNGAKKGIDVKPLVFNHVISRCQLDFIDLQSQPDGQFKFVFIYQDLSTKFVVLRPLTSKRVEEIASHLLDVFTLLGAPCVLHSSDGSEFRGAVVNSLKSMWPGFNIVHGKSQSSEFAYQDLENMIFTWMSDHGSSKWSEALKFVQFTKNKAIHPDITRSPFESLFGCRANEGLRTLNLPDAKLASLETEEQLLAHLTRVESASGSSETPSL